MSNELDLDWYTYLTEDFKGHRDSYRVADKAVFDCPKCKGTDCVRVGHVKTKIKKLGRYECSTCRNAAQIVDARKACKEKYGGLNPFQVEAVKEKIRETNLERYGVESVLSLRENHEKGISAARTPECRAKAQETLFKNYGTTSILDIPGVREKSNSAKIEKFKKLRDGIAETQRKVCSRCKVDKSLTEFSNSHKLGVKTWCIECFIEHSKLRCESDENYRLSLRLRTSMSRAMVKNKSGAKVVELLGCSIQEFRKYIESKFQPGMTWDNYGANGWHLDHIWPISKFDLTDLEQRKKAVHFSNMQPLWAIDNQKKGNKLPK
jgi:hypothetical protein